MEVKRLRARMQLSYLASSIVQCFAPVKLADRVSNNRPRDHGEDEGDHC